MLRSIIAKKRHILCIFLCLIAVFFGGIAWVQYATNPYILNEGGQISVLTGMYSGNIANNGTQQRIGILFGTSPYTREGKINLYFLYRIQAAVQLFRQGYISSILVSGDNGREGYNEPQAMKDALIAQGVDTGAIVLDYAGFSTLDTIYRGHTVFGIQSSLLITQRGQVQRGMFLCLHRGYDCVAYESTDVVWRRSSRIWIRERFAKWKMLGDIYLWNANATYPGPIENTPWSDRGEERSR